MTTHWISTWAKLLKWNWRFQWLSKNLSLLSEAGGDFKFMFSCTLMQNSKVSKGKLSFSFMTSDYSLNHFLNLSFHPQTLIQHHYALSSDYCIYIHLELPSNRYATQISLTFPNRISHKSFSLLYFKYVPINTVLSKYWLIQNEFNWLPIMSPDALYELFCSLSILMKIS